MITLIKVIEEMHKKFGAGYSPEVVPKWMLELLNKCKNPTTHLNVKLFIIKLILNVKPEIFEPYVAYVEGEGVEGGGKGKEGNWRVA
jgi:hypothetical protein